jgi:hypothetical protein
VQYPSQWLLIYCLLRENELKTSTGGALDDNVEEVTVQWPRLHEGDIQTIPLSLNDINDNCVHEIFKYLSVQDFS